ncbi:hypothetical protein SRABI123_05731 [Pseudomonas sp. Bi123]|nr:hypothetical protein SRABI123_05731 [Pseudomonas sp. Bi123]
MLVQGDARGELAARSTGARAGATAHVGVARANDAVVDVVLGVDIDRTGGLDNGGIALIAGGQLGDLAELGHLDFGGADEVGHCRFQAGEVVGVITAAGKPVLIGEGAGGINQAAGVVGPFAAVHPHRFGIVGLYAGVGQVVQRSGEVAAGGDGAALVKQLAAVDVQITASGDAGRRTGGGHFQFFTLGDFPGMSYHGTAAVIVVMRPVARTLINPGGVDTAITDGQQRTDVLYRARRQAHAAVALNRRRTVDDAVGLGALSVTVNREVAQAVDVGVAVVQRIDPQAHVAAAEDQPAIIDQRAGGGGQLLSAGQRPEVVDPAGVHGQVGSRRQAPGIVQLATHRHGGVPSTGNAGGRVEVQLCGAQAERSPAAEPTASRISTAKVDLQVAVTGDQAIVVPVAAAASQLADSQELTIGSLVEAIDIDGQAIGLDYAVVGPSVSGQGQATAGDEAAAGTTQLSGGNVEEASADVQHVAADVQQTTGTEAQVVVGGFHGAVAVVEHATDGEGGFASAAQCTQLSGLVIDARRRDGQGAFTFDDAQAIVQCAAQAQVDLLPADLPVVVTAVVEVIAGDADPALGVEAAIAVVEVAVGAGVDDGVTGLRGDPPAIVVEAGQCLEVQTLGLNDPALTIVVQVIAVTQYASDMAAEGALQAGEHTAAAVEAGGGDVEVAALGDDAPALVIDGAASFHRQVALALQGALGVIEVDGV